MGVGVGGTNITFVGVGGTGVGGMGFVAVGSARLGATGMIVGAGLFAVSSEQPRSSPASSNKKAAFIMKVGK